MSRPELRPGASPASEFEPATLERRRAWREWDERVEMYNHKVRNDDGRPAAWFRSLCNMRDHGHVHPTDVNEPEDPEAMYCKGQPVSYSQAFGPPPPPDAAELRNPPPAPGDPNALIGPDGGPISRATLYPPRRQRRRR